MSCVEAGVDDDTYRGPADQPDILDATRFDSTAYQDYTVRVAALINGQGEAHCTGVLIAPNLVLTARHCIQSYERVGDNWRWTNSYHDLVVQVGLTIGQLTDYSVTSKAVDAENQVGSGLRGNDIAVLRLATNVTNVEVAGVSAFPVAANTTYTAIGWGTVLPNGRTVFQRQQAIYKVTNRGTFEYQKRGGISYSRAELTGGRALCPGDSGGPLMVNASGILPRVVGIASLADCATVSIYQSPSAHVPFMCAAFRASGNEIPTNLLCSTYAGLSAGVPALCCSGNEMLEGF